MTSPDYLSHLIPIPPSSSSPSSTDPSQQMYDILEPLSLPPAPAVMGPARPPPSASERARERKRVDDILDALQREEEEQEGEEMNEVELKGDLISLEKSFGALFSSSSASSSSPSESKKVGESSSGSLFPSSPSHSKEAKESSSGSLFPSSPPKSEKARESSSSSGTRKFVRFSDIDGEEAGEGEARDESEPFLPPPSMPQDDAEEGQEEFDWKRSGKVMSDLVVERGDQLLSLRPSSSHPSSSSSSQHPVPPSSSSSLHQPPPSSSSLQHPTPPPPEQSSSSTPASVSATHAALPPASSALWQPANASPSTNASSLSSSTITNATSLGPSQNPTASSPPPSLPPSSSLPLSSLPTSSQPSSSTASIDTDKTSTSTASAAFKQVRPSAAKQEEARRQDTQRKPLLNPAIPTIELPDEYEFIESDDPRDSEGEVHTQDWLDEFEEEDELDDDYDEEDDDFADEEDLFDAEDMDSKLNMRDIALAHLAQRGNLTKWQAESGIIEAASSSTSETARNAWDQEWVPLDASLTGRPPPVNQFGRHNKQQQQQPTLNSENFPLTAQMEGGVSMVIPSLIPGVKPAKIIDGELIGQDDSDEEEGESQRILDALRRNVDWKPVEIPTAQKEAQKTSERMPPVLQTASKSSQRAVNVPPSERQLPASILNYLPRSGPALTVAPKPQSVASQSPEPRASSEAPAEEPKKMSRFKREQLGLI